MRSELLFSSSVSAWSGWAENNSISGNAHTIWGIMCIFSPQVSLSSSLTLTLIPSFFSPADRGKRGAGRERGREGEREGKIQFSLVPDGAGERVGGFSHFWEQESFLTSGLGAKFFILDFSTIPEPLALPSLSNGSEKG